MDTITDGTQGRNAQNMKMAVSDVMALLRPSRIIEAKIKLLINSIGKLSAIAKDLEINMLVGGGGGGGWVLGTPLYKPLRYKDVPPQRV